MSALYNNIFELAKAYIPKKDAAKMKFVVDGDTEDIKAAIKNSIPTAINQTQIFTSKVAAISADGLKNLYQLTGSEKERIIRAVFDMLVECVPLNIDPTGVQYVKRPAALIHNDNGADCKSYSLFLAGVLANLRVPFVFKFVSWDPDDENSRHVYIVCAPSLKVVKDGGVLTPEHIEKHPSKIVLDVNTKQYNYEVKKHYNPNYISYMSDIFYIGNLKQSPRQYALKTKIGSRLSGILDNLRAERKSIYNKAGKVSNRKQVLNSYNAFIGVVKDLRNAADYLVRTGKQAQAKGVVAAIAEDWTEGKYHTQSPTKIAALRAGRARLGYLPSLEGVNYKTEKERAFFRSVADGIERTGKNAIGATWIDKAWNAIKDTTKKVTESTIDFVTSSAKSVASSVKLATVAPVAVFTSDGRKWIKNEAGEFVDNTKGIFTSLAAGTLAPFTVAAEMALGKLLKDGTGYGFLYIFLTDDQAKEAPQAVRIKRERQMKIRTLLKLWFNVSNFDDMVRADFVSRSGKEPESVLADWIRQDNKDCWPTSLNSVQSFVDKEKQRKQINDKYDKAIAEATTQKETFEGLVGRYPSDGRYREGLEIWTNAIKQYEEQRQKALAEIGLEPATSAAIVAAAITAVSSLLALLINKLWPENDTAKALSETMQNTVQSGLTAYQQVKRQTVEMSNGQKIEILTDATGQALSGSVMLDNGTTVKYNRNPDGSYLGFDEWCKKQNIPNLPGYDPKAVYNEWVRVAIERDTAIDDIILKELQAYDVPTAPSIIPIFTDFQDLAKKQTAEAAEKLSQEIQNSVQNANTIVRELGPEYLPVTSATDTTGTDILTGNKNTAANTTTADNGSASGETGSGSNLKWLLIGGAVVGTYIVIHQGNKKKQNKRH